MPDWNAIEADFLATGMAYPALAKKWDVSLSTLKKKAMRGRWGDRHAAVAILAEERVPENQEEPSEEPVPVWEEPTKEKEPEPQAELITPEEIAIETRSDRIRRMLRTTDEMMDRIVNALDLIKPDDTYALKTLISALKDLREMQGLNKSELDIEEQRARIAKLKSETRITETDGHGGVLILPTIEDALLPPGNANE